jgi:hypothetical protein
MPVAGGPKITTTGILLEVDAANASSYTSGSSTWVNVFRPGTRNGTINGTLGFNQDDSKGALTFPGTTSSYVDFGNIGDLSSAWSFQVAVKPAPSASGNYTILSYTSGSNTGSWTYKLDYSSSNQSAVLSVYSATGSARVVHQVTGSVPTGSWSIVNASYGNTVIGMYVNGQPTDYVVTTGSTVGYNANNRLYLGGTFGVTSSFYTGSMASFFSYNTDVPNTQLVQNYNAYATRFGLPPSVIFPLSVDPDAFRFIEVANIINQTQINAINNLVVGLKSNNLWNKMVAIYPFVGGTAFTHKWNLKNPADADAAYRILWFGAITHDSNGIFTSAGGYGDTRFAPFTALSNPTQSNHIAMYNNRGEIGWGLADIGNTNNLTDGLLITVNYASFGNTYFNAYNPSNTSIANSFSTNPNNLNGLFVATRTDTNQSGYYRRGGLTSNTSNTSSPSTALRNNTVYVLNTNSVWGSGGHAMAFASLGTGLTQTDVDNYYTVVQAYQTTLGRQA